MQIQRAIRLCYKGPYRGQPKQGGQLPSSYTDVTDNGTATEDATVTDLDVTGPGDRANTTGEFGSQLGDIAGIKGNDRRDNSLCESDRIRKTSKFDTKCTYSDTMSEDMGDYPGNTISKKPRSRKKIQKNAVEAKSCCSDKGCTIF